MARWNTVRKMETESPTVDAFLEEVVVVSRRHGLSISHEDCHGGFLVEQLSEDNLTWLLNAADNTEEGV